MTTEKANKYKPKPWMPDYGLVEDHYEWWQSAEEVLVTCWIPEGVRAKDLDVEIHAASLHVKMKDGSQVFIEGKTTGPISVDGSTWCKDGNELELTLAKGPGSEKWWPSVVEGAKEVDVQGIEGSQYVDDSLQRRIYEEKQAQKEREAAAAAEGGDGKAEEADDAADKADDEKKDD